MSIAASAAACFRQMNGASVAHYYGAVIMLVK